MKSNGSRGCLLCESGQESGGKIRCGNADYYGSEQGPFEDKPAADAVRDLMVRDKKVETPMLPW